MANFAARTYQTILATIKANIAASPVLSSLLTNVSPVSEWQLWAFQQSLTSALNEQAAVVLVDEIETIAGQGHPQTAPWIQVQVLAFQYNVNVGYLVQVTNGITIGYATIVPADQIISNCAIVVSLFGHITIKVTTGSPASALSTNQKIALGSYLTNFMSPNQQYSILSTTGDQLWIAGVVYYNGQLNGSIQHPIITALNAYLATFSTSQALGGSFNGLVKVSDIEKVIFGVTGVTDWVPSQITITPAVGSPTNLIITSTQLARSYQTYSGYVIEDAINTFLTQITFNAANN